MAGANADSYIGVPITRFPGGLNNSLPTDALAAFGLPDPTKWHTYFNDFDIYLATDWTITTVGALSIVNSTGADGGLLVVTNAAADNDGSFLDYKIESWKFVAGKKLFFKARFKILEVVEADLIMGLQITDTTPLAVTDGVFFQKDDGDALLDFHVGKNSTYTDVTGAATLVADTFVTVAFYYDGISEIKVFVDDVHVGTAAITNLVDDEELAISFGLQNGQAVANVLTVDYIFVSKER